MAVVFYLIFKLWIFLLPRVFSLSWWCLCFHIAYFVTPLIQKGACWFILFPHSNKQMDRYYCYVSDGEWRRLRSYSGIISWNAKNCPKSKTKPNKNLPIVYEISYSFTLLTIPNAYHMSKSLEKFLLNTGYRFRLNRTWLYRAEASVYHIVRV